MISNSWRCLAALFLAFLSAAHANTTKPVNGLWGLNAETNLAVGRAFNLETSQGFLVVTMYAYTNTGAPTFYVGAAPMTANNTASVALLEPEGGTCLGCVPTSGRQRANKGTAFFEFTSSTTGFVTLPGESRKAFFKGPVTWPAAPDGLYGLWVWTRVATSVSTAFADYTVLTTKLSPSSSGSGIAVSSDGRYGCELQTSGAAAGYVLCIAITSTGSTRFIALVKWHGNEMDGAWQYSSSSTTTDVFTAKRLVDGNGNYETVKSALVASDPAMLRAVFEEHAQRLAARAE